MKKNIHILIFLLLITMSLSCNNNNQGNIEDDGPDDQDIRIEGYQKQSETDNAYANNDVGEYLRYNSEEGSASFPTSKKSIKLLAAALVEKNENAEITSSSELKSLANLNLEEDYQVSKNDLNTIIVALESAIQSGAFEGKADLMAMKQDVEKIELERNGKDMGKHLESFFDRSAEILRSIEAKGK